MKSVVLMFALLGATLSSHISYSSTSSTDARFFFVYSGSVSKGNYAEFHYDHSYISSKNVTKPFIKRAACVEGDRLEFHENKFWCNNKYIASPLDLDSNGDELPRFFFRGVVPSGKAFMLGDSTLSGDSRYFGFIDLASARRAIPLW